MITQLRKPFAFLSNLSTAEIEYLGKTYNSVEAAYQAQKCSSEEEKERFSRLKNPVAAKQIGSRIKTRETWEEEKLDIMLDLLRIKYNQPKFKEKLLSTGSEEICEGNTWHDNFWGSCSCPDCKDKEHLNHLGRLLMQVREEVS